MIDRECRRSSGEHHIGRGLYLYLPATVFSMLYHFFLLKKAVDATGMTLYVPYLEDTENNDLSKTRVTGPKINYFGIIAQRAQESIPAIVAVPLSLDKENGAIGHEPHERPSLRNILRYVILKFSAVRAHRIVHLFLHRVTQHPSIRTLHNRLRKDRHLFVFVENGLVLQCALHNWLRGIGITWITPIPKQLDTNPPEDPSPLEEKLTTLNPYPDWTVPLSVAANRVSRYINGYILPLCATIDTQIPDYEAIHSNYKKSCLLTNNLGHPIDIILSNRFREMGVPVVTMQHGSTGLLDIYYLTLPFFSLMFTDGSVFYQEHEQNFYRRVAPDPDIFHHVHGMRKSLSAPFPSLARRMCRRIWNLSSEQTLLLYAPTHFKDYHVFPLDVFNMPYWRVIREIIDEVFAHLPMECVIKNHRKGLWELNQKKLYLNRRDPLMEIELPDGVSIQDYPQLTYSRYAADILVLDHATSTMNWVMATDIPIVYIDLEMSPLVAEVADAMKDALFYIDTRDDSWKEELRSVLSQPIETIREQWHTMAGKRERFINHYVLGPHGKMSDLNRWIYQVPVRSWPEREEE
ncbi:MAG: hypothetical protein HQL50_02525 [Magnetococcales bacterium]|nr:hypothetical protein [Magnetococcales bacterium]